ncbi:RNase H domain-containing protein [Trichonephila clavipes]|nr:RNase H domain-containing protein [Trichonephila clavipes]
MVYSQKASGSLFPSLHNWILKEKNKLQELGKVCFLQWLHAHVYITGNGNGDKLAKEARNLNNNSFINVTLLDANAVPNFKLREKSIPLKHQICNISGDRLTTKTIGRLRTGRLRGMKFERDGRRTYKNCGNCLDTELTAAHIFNYPAILATLQEILVLFWSKNLYVDNIEHIAKTVIWAHGTVRFGLVMDTTSSSTTKHPWAAYNGQRRFSFSFQRSQFIYISYQKHLELSIIISFLDLTG